MLSNDFTPEERDLLCQKDFFRIKANIVQKWMTRLEAVQTQIAHQQDPLWPEPWQDAGYRISRGERYQGCPYAVADGPAVFEKEDILAYRIICRWGEDTAFTLLVKGRYWTRFRACIENGLNEGFDNLSKVFLAVGESPWEHHFGQYNYQPLTGSMLNEQHYWERNFCKLAIRQKCDASFEELQRKALDSLQFYLKLLYGPT